MIECTQCDECETIYRMNALGRQMLRVRGPGKCPGCGERMLQVWIAVDMLDDATLAGL